MRAGCVAPAGAYFSRFVPFPTAAAAGYGLPPLWGSMGKATRSLFDSLARQKRTRRGINFLLPNGAFIPASSQLRSLPVPALHLT